MGVDNQLIWTMSQPMSNQHQQRGRAEVGGEEVALLHLSPLWGGGVVVQASYRWLIGADNGHVAKHGQYSMYVCMCNIPTLIHIYVYSLVLVSGGRGRHEKGSSLVGRGFLSRGAVGVEASLSLPHLSSYYWGHYYWWLLTMDDYSVPQYCVCVLLLIYMR